MGTKRNIAVLIIAVGTVLLATTVWSVFAGTDGTTTWPSDLGPRLDGAWMLTVEAPGIHLVHNCFLVAQDSQGLKYTEYVEHTLCSPSFFGAFPEANAHSQMIGQAEKTSPTTFRNTLIHYGLKTGGVIDEMVYIAVTSSETTMVDADHAVFTANQAIYLPAQDADRDGFPDEGQKPILCSPYTGKVTRVKLMPMCEPTPVPGATNP